MRRIIISVILICLAAGSGYGVINYALVSVGDNCFVYGPGTDTAFDSPEAIARIMKLWKTRGYTGVYWRTDLGDYDPNEIVRFHGAPLEPLIDLGIRRGVEDTYQRFCVLRTARQAAEAQGLQFWVYHPTIYSDGASPQVVQPGYMPWSFQHRYTFEHPEVLTIDRAGKVQHLVREYAYPGARANKIYEYVYMARTFGIKNFLISMRTEAAQTEPGPVKADQYGFNQPIVDAMLSQYGVNILTDSRFDIYNPSWNTSDPMVQNWHRLRGGYLTQLYRELRQALDAVDPTIRLSIQIPGDYAGPDLGNWVLDWRSWINEGLVNEIVQSVTLQAGWDSTVNKGYLCDILHGIGLLPISTYRNFINASPHPDIKLIQAGAYERFGTNPLPSEADGWQTFWTIEAFDIAWYQRWQQWKRDLGDFGYIKFIDQNFDSWTPYSSGYTGAEGDARYHPELRACPGGWFSLGTGNNSLPVVQNVIRHGAAGNAIKLTRAPDSSGGLKAYHSGGFDHSSFQTRVDNVIENGTCTFDFWVYRPSVSSALTIFLQYSRYTDSGLSVGINIGTGNGNEEEAPVQVWGYGHWFTTMYGLPVGLWEKFTIVVDVDQKKYTVFAGPNREMTLMSNMPYTTNINRFDRILFAPGNPVGNVCYIDDVSLKWTPKLFYSPDRKYTYLSDNFENHAVHGTVSGKSPLIGGNWKVSPTGAANSFFAENVLSFADGALSLGASSNNNAFLYSTDTAKLRLAEDQLVTVDYDIYLRKNYQAVIGLQKSLTGNVTAAVNPNVKWKCWNGTQYAATDVNVVGADGWDIWHHVQMALDPATRTYKVVVQPCGALPVLLGTYAWDSGTAVNDEVFFIFKPQGTYGQATYIDNLKITYGPTCPAGDLDNDCDVDLTDFSKMARNWFDFAPVGDFSGDKFVDWKDVLTFSLNWLSN